MINNWLSRLPRWNHGDPAAWLPFLRRYEDAEVALATKLGELPGCSLIRGLDGGRMQLRLAGISVRSVTGLPGTCRLWIATVRSRPQG